MSRASTLKVRCLVSFRLLTLLSVVVAMVLTASCLRLPSRKGVPALYVANLQANGSIVVYTAKRGGTNNLPQLALQQPAPLPGAAPMALRVVGSTLYAALGNGEVAQFTINHLNGGLTARGAVPIGSPPFAMTSTASNVFVANRGSNNISVFSIDAQGNLVSVQTAASQGAQALEIAGTFLLVGSRATGPGTGAQLCSVAIQTGGALAAAPASCFQMPGPPESLAFANGVVFALFRAPSFVTTNPVYKVQAFTLNSTTGTIGARGVPLDVGPANAGAIAASTDGRMLFLSRQGDFLTLSTADPLQVIAAGSSTPIRQSQWCVWPPAGAGSIVVDPRGDTIYVTDPVSTTAGNITGARVSALGIGVNGVLTATSCDSPGSSAGAMALFLP